MKDNIELHEIEVKILLAVANAEGPLGIADISAAMGLTSPAQREKLVHFCNHLVAIEFAATRHFNPNLWSRMVDTVNRGPARAEGSGLVLTDISRSYLVKHGLI